MAARSSSLGAQALCVLSLKGLLLLFQDVISNISEDVLLHICQVLAARSSIVLGHMHFVCIVLKKAYFYNFKKLSIVCEEVLLHIRQVLGHKHFLCIVLKKAYFYNFKELSIYLKKCVAAHPPSSGCKEQHSLGAEALYVLIVIEKRLIL
jgi:hypothetical protein